MTGYIDNEKLFCYDEANDNMQKGSHPMKKILALLLVTVMVLSLVACGDNTGEVTTNTSEVTTNNNEVETNNSEAEVNHEPQLTEQQQMVVNATKQFLASDSYKEVVDAYEKIMGSEATEPKVMQAIDYQLDDFNGYNVDVMLIKLQANVLFGDSSWNEVQILVDKESGDVCDRISVDEWVKTFDGTCDSEEDVNPMLIMCYCFFENNGRVWTEMETLMELTEADLDVINNNLK